MTESNIPNFNWSLPRAFNDAINKCKFETGDVLYPTLNGYAKWGDAIKLVDQFIQIESTGGLSENDSKGMSSRAIFQANWYSQITFNVIQTRDMSKQMVMTTQGHLYNILWKGELHELAHSTFEPPLFLQSDFGIMDINRPRPKRTEFDSKDKYFFALEDYNEWYRGEKEKTRNSVREYLNNRFSVLPNHIFGFGYDSTNSNSIEKMNDLKSVFEKNRFDYSIKIVSAKEIIDYISYSFAPTQEIVVFTLPPIERKEIDEMLKKALHKPSKKAKTTRFAIDRHGILLYN